MLSCRDCCDDHDLQACADKLDRELKTYGCPPKFPTDEEDEEPVAPAAAVSFWPTGCVLMKQSTHELCAMLCTCCPRGRQQQHVGGL
jgi:hypothetical protein